MRSLRQVLGRAERGEVPVAGVDPDVAWNTLSTIGAGSVADVDAKGAVYPRNRPLAIEVWFGSGDRWVQGSADAGVRQTRVVGLPIIETRQRLGDGDIVQTAWADEPGDGQGRVVIELTNETDVAVVAAVVVRPRMVGGAAGSISEIRVAGSLIVADRLPIVDLTREPGDVAVVVDDEASLLGLLEASNDGLVGHGALTDPQGRASLAAMIPLTPTVSRQILVVDGREETTVAPAPLDRVVNGWRAHLDRAAEIELPAWPKHVPPALLSSLLGAVPDVSGPLGASPWQREDDAALAVALGRFGVPWAAAAVTERLLVAVADGSIRQDHWPAVAISCALIAGTPEGDDVIARHADAAVLVAGATLTHASTPEFDGSLIDVVGIAHGTAAAADAASIVGKPPVGNALLQLGRLGVGLSSIDSSAVAETLATAPKPYGIADLSLAMIVTPHVDRPADAIIPLRALAGSTWRWGRGGCGDSPHARADILIGLRAMCVATSGGVVDVLPGMTRAWLGQNLRVAKLPTPGGLLSFALRWHGPRAALLWEFAGESDVAVRFTCASIDPLFESVDRSGEVLLAEPTHLVER